jgi:hypothetical protein
VTLIEMLVTLAVLLLMMTFIVQIFQAATGSLNSAQVYQELDNQLRLLDKTIRSDLTGVTCKMTPPNDPKNNPGYFEYGENEFADIQGEDADDYIRFTAKAPAGRPFTGRMWVPPPVPISQMNATQLQIYLSSQPITITSEYAEIIYFLRNGNLYRRVLLVAPERQKAVANTINNVWQYLDPVNQNLSTFFFEPTGLGGSAIWGNSTPQGISWQGVNDLSASPISRGQATTNAIHLNTLGDLTNREKRPFYQKFSDDFLNSAGAADPDGLADDLNGDNVPDLYPTLYGGPAAGVYNPLNSLNGNRLVYMSTIFRPTTWGMLGFPYVFPGAYSHPQVLSTTAYGWIHSPQPQVAVNNAAVTFDENPLVYLNNINHNPMDVGDNVALPLNQVGYVQTWWGFPTWRETLSPRWQDPTFQINTNSAQPFGLGRRNANVVPVTNTNTLLPAMTATYRNTPLRSTPQLFTDGWGSNSWFFNTTQLLTLWSQYSWEDDLIMTGVRSFDVKAYDDSLSTYADLGWGDDPRLTPSVSPANTWLGTNNPIPYLAGNLDAVTGNYNAPAYGSINAGLFDIVNQTFAHEGRIPPLSTDFRFDAQYGAVPSGYYAGFPNYTGNIGDDRNTVTRLRRVWDSWSTDYTRAPATGVFNNPGNPADHRNGFPWGPPYSPPIYPSYPAPYPAPLRGLQIQVRVVDPSNQRIKSLTIRHDFTDKL